MGKSEPMWLLLLSTHQTQLFFLYIGNSKSQNYVPASESKAGEIGYVSSVNSKPRRVRAVTASIPVATESLQKFHTVQGEKFDTVQGKNFHTVHVL